MEQTAIVKSKKRVSGWIAAALAAVVGLSIWPVLRSNGPAAPDWPAIDAAWRQGRVALLIRHMARCDRSPDPCLDTDGHGITRAGARRAERMALGIRARLDLALADIWHSPVRRTAQTARILFGDANRPAPWLRRDCKTQMQAAIFDHWRPGRNLVLVTHASCIEYLTDARGRRLIDPDADSYGWAWFLIRQSDDDWRPAGALTPEGWSPRD